MGKTTLAKAVVRAWKGPVTCLDLGYPADLDTLEEPMLVLRDTQGLIVIDEGQRRPDLFPQTSEGLAGRIYYSELPGLTTQEVEMHRWKRLWMRGGGMSQARRESV